MRKISFAILMTFVCLSTAFGQEAKKDIETLKTKMDAFASKTGTITKFIDYNLPSLKTSFSKPETRIRKISNGGSTGTFFYQIEKQGQYGNTIASIEYGDLLEVIKALKSLKGDVEKDVAFNPDYLENKFVTVDGFQIGYYVNKGKPTWYIKLEKFGSDKTLYIDDVTVIENAFDLAKTKIEELKRQN